MGQFFVSSIVTDYLNDLQPGLTKLLKQDDGTNVEHFVHAQRGIHAVDDGTDLNFYAQDGLGSVRAEVDNMAVVQSSMSYDPYGNPMGAYGAGFGFTGEQTDANGSVFLRARYYEPSMGVFNALDPLEGKTCTPMTLNGYSWVEGNPVTNIDPEGMQSDTTVNNCNSSDPRHCNYANWMLKIYPESEDLDYWLRFPVENLKELFEFHIGTGDGIQNFTSLDFNQGSDALAIVPLNFNPSGGVREDEQRRAMNILHNQEEDFGRPLTFAEILAIVYHVEVAITQTTDLFRDQDSGVSTDGNTLQQFRNLIKEGFARNFHGQCRRSTSDTGTCGPARLVQYLSEVQNWYLPNTDFGGYTTHLDEPARRWQRENGWGGACGSPYTWGNAPNENFQLPENSETPLIGHGHVIDWIRYEDGDFDFFVIQEPSFCLGDASLPKRVLAKFDVCYS